MPRLAISLVTLALGLQLAAAAWLPLGGLDQQELLAKLKNKGEPLTNQKVFEILSKAKDKDSTRVGDFSARQLLRTRDLSLELCTGEELKLREQIASSPGLETSNNVNDYCRENLAQFVAFCSRNVDKLFRRQIVAIGAAIPRDLRYFVTGVQRAEKNLGKGTTVLEAIKDYLANGGTYVDENYKKTIASGCRTVTENLTSIDAIREYAAKFKAPLNLNYALQEWTRLNDYCKVHVKHIPA